MKEKISFLQLFLYGVSDEKLLEALGNFYADPDMVTDLQDLIGTYLRPELQWMTCISIIDAMEFCYEDARSNGNIN